MKNFSTKCKWLAIAGFVGILYLPHGNVALAQTENAPKKMKVKIVQNINGVETMRDTIIEVNGNETLPDISEIRKMMIPFSAGDAKEREVEIKALREKGELGELKTFRREFKPGELSEVKKMRVIKMEPGKDFKIDSLIGNRRIRIEGLENAEELLRNENFKAEFENLKDVEGANVLKTVTRNGDSLVVSKK